MFDLEAAGLELMRRRHVNTGKQQSEGEDGDAEAIPKGMQERGRLAMRQGARAGAVENTHGNAP